MQVTVNDLISACDTRFCQSGERTIPTPTPFGDGDLGAVTRLKQVMCRWSSFSRGGYKACGHPTAAVFLRSLPSTLVRLAVHYGHLVQFIVIFEKLHFE